MSSLLQSLFSPDKKKEKDVTPPVAARKDSASEDQATKPVRFSATVTPPAPAEEKKLRAEVLENLKEPSPILRIAIPPSESASSTLPQRSPGRRLSHPEKPVHNIFAFFRASILSSPLIV